MSGRIIGGIEFAAHRQRLFKEDWQKEQSSIGQAIADREFGRFRFGCPERRDSRGFGDAVRRGSDGRDCRIRRGRPPNRSANDERDFVARPIPP